MATVVQEPRHKTRKHGKEHPLQPAPPTEPGSTGGVRLETPEQLLRVDQFERHPANRIPKDEDVAQLAQSILDMGQIDAILARRREGCELLQILSGETRWRAHRAIGAVLIKARVIECSDREALEYLATANTERKDLTTSDRARLAAAMQAAGFKRDEIAPKIGVVSGSAVSNMIKLLDAPEVWLHALDFGVTWEGDRQAIHEGTVREVAKFGHVPQLAEHLLGAFTDGTWFPVTREEQIDRLYACVGKLTRSMRESQWYGEWNGVAVHGYHKPRFKLDAEVRERLRIVTVPTQGGGGDEVSLNVEEFDRLQWDALAKMTAKRDRATAKAAGSESSDAAREKEQADKLREWVKEWRIALLRIGLAEIVAEDTAPLMFCWLATELARDYRMGLNGCLEEAGANVTGAKSSKANIAGMRSRSTTETLLAAAKAVRGGAHDLAAGLVLRRACQLALWPAAESDQPPEHLPTLQAEDVEAWAEEHGVTVAGQWFAGRSPGRQREWIRALLKRHTTAQLLDLCGELDVDARAITGKAAVVQVLMDAHSGLAALEVPAVVEAGGKGRKKRK